MPKPNLAESILALLAGRARSAAIYGDLTEMAATRGRVWFAAAYLRTLIEVGWRAPVAFVCGFFALRLMFLLFRVWMAQTPAEWRFEPYLLNQAGPLIACVAQTAWFVLPYAAVRYGLRDRFAQLTLAVFAVATLTLLDIPWASTTIAVLAALAVAAGLLTQIWRRPLVILAAGTAGAVAAMGACYAILAEVFHLSVYRYDAAGAAAFHAGERIAQLVSLLTVALVCTRLHRWLMEPGAQPNGASPAGAAHA